MSEEEPTDIEQLRGFLGDFVGTAALELFADEQLPQVQVYDDVRHSDRLRSGKIGTWHVVQNQHPIRDAAVDVFGLSSRVVIFSDLVGCTFTARNSGCQFYVLGTVQDSKIKASGPGSHIYLLGRVSGNSTIQAENYSVAFSRQSSVTFRGNEVAMPERLREIAAPDPPTVPLSSPSGRREPRSPWAARLRWGLTGPAAHDSTSHHRRPRRGHYGP